MKLLTTDEELNEVCEVLDKTRPSTEFVKVRRATLDNMYQDNQIMFTEISKDIIVTRYKDVT